MSENLNRIHAGSGWLASLREAVSAMGDAFSRFPVTTVLLGLAAVQANALIADTSLLSPWLFGAASQEHQLFAMIAAVLASFAATLFCQARSISGGSQQLLPALAGFAAFCVMWPPLGIQTVEWAFVLSLAALVPIAPFAGRGTGDAFWMFTARLVYAAALALLAFILFGGGVSAILASLSHLFGVDIPEDLYGHIWVSMGLFIAPLFALGQTPDEFDLEPGGREHEITQRGMRALGDFAAIPLLIIYAVILHLYTGKILITGEVPRGQIGWLVLTYGVCTVAVLLLTKPFLDSARAPSRFFVRFWPLLLLAPLGVLFYALWLRVSAFGWTVDRYFLGLFGIVTLALVVGQAVRRLRGDIRVIAGLPVAALLVGSFGPQGALEWSIRSQQTRFLDIVRSQPTDLQTKAEALSVLRYLNGEDAALGVAPDGFVPTNEESLYRQIALAWKLDPDNPVQRGREGFSYNSNSIVAFALDGYDVLLHNVELYRENTPTEPLSLPSGTDIKLVLKRNAISLEEEGHAPVVFKVDTAEIVALSSSEIRPARLRLVEGGREIVLIPDHLYASSFPETVLKSFSGTVLLRSSDWK